jgi:hypothetical protein
MPTANTDTSAQEGRCSTVLAAVAVSQLVIRACFAEIQHALAASMWQLCMWRELTALNGGDCYKWILSPLNGTLHTS